MEHDSTPDCVASLGREAEHSTVRGERTEGGVRAEEAREVRSDVCVAAWRREILAKPCLDRPFFCKFL